MKKNPLDRLAAGPRREIAPGVHLLPGFGNTTFVIGTDGVAVVDPGLFTNGPRVVSELRAITDRPVRYERVRALHATGEPADLQRALHLVDFVIFGGGADVASARALKADLLRARAKVEPSFVARNILNAAAVLERG